MNTPAAAAELVNSEVNTYAEEQKAGNQSANNKYLMKERFEIDFSTPIPWLDNNAAKAYAVTDRIDAGRRLFALICSNETSPRTSLLAYLKSIENNSLMKLVEFGPVNYIPDGSKNMALIYNMPMGGKVFENGVSSLDLKNNPDKFKSMLLSFLGIADTFKSYGITHRAIRADNLYYRNADKSDIVIGDCAASFPAYHQPPEFETFESLYADKNARGDGNEKDDIYAIGVTMLCLLVGHELNSGLSAPEMMYHKLKKGSYLVLAGKEKFPSAYINLFKGLLNDDSELRWNYSQVYGSFEGKQASYGQQGSFERPKRALSINGEKVYMPCDVAYSLQNNIDEAYELITSGKITDWIKNGLDNEKLSLKVDSVVKQEALSAGNKDLTVARVCILLAHNMPIRYKGISFFPDGIAKAVFMNMKDKNPLKSFVEIFSSDLIKLWYQEQEKLRCPANAGEFRVYIMRQDIGYGIERIIYDFDNDLPCISPLFGDEYVNGPQQVLRALNNSYKDSLNNTQPYDRIIIAYLRCKMGKKIENIVVDLNSGRDEIKASAILRLYTSMQNKFGPAQLPNLAKWLANFVKPLIQVYHNKKYQKYLERELLKIYKDGKLHKLVDLLENEDALEKDRKDYASALNEASYLMLEKTKITGNSLKLEEEAREAAIRIVSLLAVLVMAVSFAINLVSWVLK